MDDDIKKLQKHAGITESSAYDAVHTFINGNIDDTFKATGGDIAEFAKILLMLQQEGGHEEMMRLIEIAAKDIYQAYTRG